MAESASTAIGEPAGMPTTPRADGRVSWATPQRVLLLVAAALAIGVALVVIRWVIPPVRDIWVPQANAAGGAVPAFWASVVANLTFAVLLVLAAVFNGLRRRAICWLLAVLALGALVQALMYLDAAAAFHGPRPGRMLPTITRLRFLALADATAGVLVLIAALTSVRRRTVRAVAAGPVEGRRTG